MENALDACQRGGQRKQIHVEITELDWVAVSSGAPLPSEASGLYQLKGAQVPNGASRDELSLATGRCARS